MADQRVVQVLFDEDPQFFEPGNGPVAPEEYGLSAATIALLAEYRRLLRIAELDPYRPTPTVEEVEEERALVHRLVRALWVEMPPDVFLLTDRYAPDPVLDTSNGFWSFERPEGVDHLEDDIVGYDAPDDEGSGEGGDDVDDLGLDDDAPPLSDAAVRLALTRSVDGGLHLEDWLALWLEADRRGRQRLLETLLDG